MFKNAKAAVVTLSSDDRIEETQMIDVMGLPAGTSLEIGYFIKVGEDLLFVNNYVTIKMGIDSAKVIEGYQQH